MNAIISFWWIPVLIVFMAINAISSYYLNVFNDTRWWIICICMNIFPLWVFVARYSRNLVADAMAYDLLSFFTFQLVVFILGASSNFTTIQWCGFALAMIGFVMLRSGELF